MTTESDIVQVEHIGTRERRADTMSGEGTVWHGQGDVKPVSRRAWEKHLSRYPDLWRLAEPKTAPPPAVAAPGLGSAAAAAQGAGDAPKPDGDAPPPPAAGVQYDYPALDKAELVKLATERKLDFDGRIAKAELIKLLVAADAAAAAQGSQEPAAA
jgi:hypothetical protein